MPADMLTLLLLGVSLMAVCVVGYGAVQPEAGLLRRFLSFLAASLLLSWGIALLDLHAEHVRCRQAKCPLRQLWERDKCPCKPDCCKPDCCPCKPDCCKPCCPAPQLAPQAPKVMPRCEDEPCGMVNLLKVEGDRVLLWVPSHTPWDGQGAGEYQWLTRQEFQERFGVRRDWQKLQPSW